MQDLLQDFGNNDVKDAPDNRARRERFFTNLPKRVVTTEPDWMATPPMQSRGLRAFNTCLLAGMLIVLAGLVAL